MTYEQFDVVVVPFPFTDSPVTKKRPALVISNETTFNALLGRSVLSMITTASHAPWPLDVTINNLKHAGLPSPSVVRMKLFTLDHGLIIQTIGSLESQDTEGVRMSLFQLFGLR